MILHAFSRPFSTHHFRILKHADTGVKMASQIRASATLLIRNVSSQKVRN